MNSRFRLFYAAAILVPVLVAAQAVKKPPMPPLPGPGATPGSQQGVLEPPPGLAGNQPTQRSVSYAQWAKEYFKVFAIPKKDAILLGHGRVRPHRVLGAVLQIVGEQGDNYLVRNLSPEDPQSTAHVTWARHEGAEVFAGMKKEYFRDKYLIVDDETVPPPFTDRVKFVRGDEGLPSGGRWQMSFDIADMDGDGLPDLVFGPQRMGPATPYIFLQQKDGSWKLWRTTVWPTKGLRLDYGAVRVADFDGDGHPDIAIACHFLKTYVLYGDGKGDFTRFVEVPKMNDQTSSRALTVADFNGDGRPDIASLAEIDINVATTRRIVSGLVTVALNLPSGWKATGTGFPTAFQGDWISAGDVLGSGRPDLLLTSRSQNETELVFHNPDGGEKWEPTASLSMPINAFVVSNAVGPLDRFPQPDLVECFEQFNPWKVEPPTQACVIYRYHDAAGRKLETPTHTVLFREKVEFVNYQAAAIGDVDGDGLNDVVVASDTGRVRVFLQGADGAFYEQRNAGMDQPGTQIFDLKVADLEHSGRCAIIFAGSPAGGASGGGVWVYKAVRAGEAGGKTSKAP